jgi:hypothetical protein
MHRTFLALVGLAAVAGCDDHLFPTPCGSVPQPTWDGVQTILQSNCSQCHAGPDAPAGYGIVLTPDGENNSLRIDAQDPDSSLLASYEPEGAPLHSPPWSGELVVPGDSANSVLYQAVSWTGTFTNMPLGASEPLCDGAPEPTPVTVIRDWIDAGAEGLVTPMTDTSP